jgi:PKD repeat protein
MKATHLTRTLLILLSLIVGIMLTMPTIAATPTDTYSLTWFSVNNGGGSSVSDKYALNSSVGQSVAGSLTGGSYQLNVGYWPAAAETDIDVPIANLQVNSSGPTVLSYSTVFTASSGSGSNVSYVWNFGDNSLSNGAATSHTFIAIGLYHVTVTATNNVSMIAASTQILVHTGKIYLPLVMRNFVTLPPQDGF